MGVDRTNHCVHCGQYVVPGICHPTIKYETHTVERCRDALKRRLLEATATGEANGCMVANVRLTRTTTGEVKAVFHLTPDQRRELREHPEKYPNGLIGTGRIEESMTDTNRVDLVAARALCEAATAGPWTVIEPGHGLGGDYKCVRYGSDERYTSLEMRPADAAFCAEARALVPELVAEVETLRGLGCRCEVLDASEGGGTDPRSCPEHGYEMGRRHERNVYLEEKREIEAKLSATEARADESDAEVESLEKALDLKFEEHDQELKTLEHSTLRPKLVAAEQEVVRLRTQASEQIDAATQAILKCVAAEKRAEAAETLLRTATRFDFSGPGGQWVAIENRPREWQVRGRGIHADPAQTKRSFSRDDAIAEASRRAGAKADAP